MAEMPKEPQIQPRSARRLRTSNKRNDLSAPRTIVVIAFDGCQTLDVNGPWEVFAQAAELALKKYSRPFYQLVLASPHGGNVATSLACSSVARFHRGGDGTDRHRLGRRWGSGQD